MNVTDFNFELPPELIAQDPLEDRSASRLLVLDKKTGEMEHRHFRDILHYLKKGDCLVINDTKVIPARLMGHKVGTDAGIEVLLLKRKSDNVWETLVKPGKKMKVGAEVSFGDGLLKGKVIDVVDEGNRLIQFEYDGIFEEILDKLGQMPHPKAKTPKNKKTFVIENNENLPFSYSTSAADLIDRMETEGVISAPNHAGKREILVPERS